MASVSSGFNTTKFCGWRSLAVKVSKRASSLRIVGFFLALGADGAFGFGTFSKQEIGAAKDSKQRKVPRFKCFGDMDAPDWILAEITVLARISSVRLKLIVTQVLASLQGLSMDYAKVTKLTADTGFESTDTMAAIAVLKHIISSAAKFDCDDLTLENELQQLGLPKEHTVALCRPYREKKDVLRDFLQQQTFRVSKVEEVDWRLDFVVSSSSIADLAVPSAELKIKYVDFSGEDRATQSHLISFTVSDDKLRTLDHELREASAVMDSFI